MSFQNMKKNRMGFDELSTKLKASAGNKNYDDERLWYPKLDDVGSGYAVIRFLPTSENDELPFAKIFTHGFKGATGKWYFENCPTTKDNDCPVCAANKDIVEGYGGWDSTPKDVKDGVIRNRKRKLSYYSNIYIVDDPENPENNGTVRLFKYGTKIFDKIKLAAEPEFKVDKPIQPFDMWEGANFELKIRKVDKQTNYDSSGFMEVSKLLPTDKEMEKIYNSEFTLSELDAEDKFKPLEDLQKNFDRVEGNKNTTKKSTTNESADESSKISDKPQFGGKKDKTEESKPEPVIDNPIDGDDGDDDAMSYFAGLAEE